MSAPEACELHELTNCSICTGLDRRERMASGPVAAHWPGRCADCGEWFDVGDEIRYSDEDAGWIGECCG